MRLPSLEEIRDAAQRVSEWAVRTPLVRLNVDGAPSEVYLKLENLQPIGAFKIRGAGNALAQVDPARLARGVYTASAGNMAQGLAWHARRLGIACTAVVPSGLQPKAARTSRRDAKPPKAKAPEMGRDIPARTAGRR